MGLEVDPSLPLIAFIGRLEGQKGADLILAATSDLLSLERPVNAAPLASAGAASALSSRLHDRIGHLKEEDIDAREREGPRSANETEAATCAGSLQLCLLGTGQKWQEQCLAQLEHRFPGIWHECYRAKMTCFYYCGPRRQSAGKLHVFLVVTKTSLCFWCKLKKLFGHNIQAIPVFSFWTFFLRGIHFTA